MREEEGKKEEERQRKTKGLTVGKERTFLRYRKRVREVEGREGNNQEGRKEKGEGKA